MRRCGNQRRTRPTRSASSRPCTERIRNSPIIHRMLHRSVTPTRHSDISHSPTCPISRPRVGPRSSPPPRNMPTQTQRYKYPSTTAAPSPNRGGPNSWVGNTPKSPDARPSSTWTDSADPNRSTRSATRTSRAPSISPNTASHRTSTTKEAGPFRNSIASCTATRTSATTWRRPNDGCRRSLISMPTARSTPTITSDTIPTACTGSRRPPSSGIVTRRNWIRGAISRCGATHWIVSASNRYIWGPSRRCFEIIGNG
mmetsp:Transcript_12720/g.35110  ORF Transcript_12720/g.35110 Transcript_12720/m.35110 type:complete len:256 (-) Transcript_12720:155-922(-)